jgi:hypothetical protein
MHAQHFDRLARLYAVSSDQDHHPSLAPTLSRRRILAALTLVTFGASNSLHQVAAGPGCKNVGRKCQRARQCCSGVCEGKKDKKRCRAHDTGGCRAGQRSTGCGGSVDIDCTTSADLLGACQTTTGNAGFCAASGDCFRCRKDADCRAVCGPRAACVRCEESCSGVGGTACLGPDACDFQD